MRLVPDVVRLLRRLAGDRTLSRSIRIRLWLLLIYLISPIDLIPDFIPVLGYADDAIIVAIALRSITRRAGPEALERHWPGTPEGPPPSSPSQAWDRNDHDIGLTEVGALNANLWR